MKKVLILSENELKILIKKVLKEYNFRVRNKNGDVDSTFEFPINKKQDTILQEQVKQVSGDPYEYRKEGNIYYTRKKGLNKPWIKATGKAAEAIASKIYGVKSQSGSTRSVKTYCEPYPKTSNILKGGPEQYQKLAGDLRTKGIPNRLACEISFIKLRLEYQFKSFFVYDPRQNLLYCFGPLGAFIAKTTTVDGANVQSQDAEIIAQSLWSWQQRVESLGYVWDPKTESYADKSNENRTYSKQAVYDDIEENLLRFIPKGIYTIRGLGRRDGYQGDGTNLFWLSTEDGEKMVQAIHGIVNKPDRMEAFETLRKSLESSINSPQVPESYINLVEEYLETDRFNKSYGCLNVPAEFIQKTIPYAQGAMVFVMGEGQENYLVQNSSEFFQKMGQSEDCVDPSSLGNQLPEINSVA